MVGICPTQNHHLSGHKSVFARLFVALTHACVHLSKQGHICVTYLGFIPMPRDVTKLFSFVLLHVHNYNTNSCTLQL